MDTNNSNEILVALAELRQEVKHISKQVESIPNLTETVIRNNESTKAAHVRLNKIEDNQRWAWRSIGGILIAFIFDKLFM